MSNAETAPNLSSLLLRVEGATGADREIDLDVLLGAGCLQLQKPPFEVILWPDGVRIWESFGTDRIPVTASLDAALALCERIAAERGLHSHAVDLLNEATEAMLARGWKPNQPLAPQLARYLIVVLLESLIERAEDGTAEAELGPGRTK